jgi:hypothetical protein
MMAAEILKRGGVEHHRRICTQAPDQNLFCIGTGHGMHGIERHLEAACDQCADRVEIEQGFHQFGIVGYGIDHFNDHAVHFEGSDLIKIGVVEIRDQIAVDHLAAGINCVGDLLGRRPAIGHIVLDAEILCRAARIVARRQDQAAERSIFADQMRGCRRRENAALAHQHATEPVCRRHPHGGLDDLTIVEPAIAANHQCGAFKALETVKDGLDEGLGIAGGLKHGNLLAQPGGSRFLVRKGRDFYCADHHYLLC